VPARYLLLSRRIGRSQNGLAGGSSGPRPPASVPPWPPGPPWPAGSAGGGAGAGRGLPPDRCLAPAAGQPLAGQAGPDPLDPPLMDGADPPARARLLTGAEDTADPVDAARARVPAPAERPAPRDQPPADPTDPADPFEPISPLEPFEPFDPLDPFEPLDPLDPFEPRPVRAGRSSGGATRAAPPSASAAFRARTDPGPPLTPLTTRRELVLTWPSPSTGGGASGRSRDA